MNKRQKKKMKTKCLPVIADEYNLMTMTETELKEALEEEQRFKLRYGYRKKYANLKKGKYLKYYFPVGKVYSETLAKTLEMCRTKRSRTYTQTQTTEEIKQMLDVED